MFKKRTNTIDYSHEITTTAFGYELFREVLLPELLGNEQPNILYWTGKEIARKFPLSTREEIEQFFKDAGWGALTIAQEKKNEISYLIQSPLIEERKKTSRDDCYQLEAGFLAEQFQYMLQCITEAYETSKKNDVQITIKWDPKDKINLG
ncbi:YslB family protein [Guptibacillus algicola]|uniref:YslB family protein n=1 Tax=Guptibacillus algicola TaxID=225844 RepID=UPI001CD1A105|nr:YslB family protein [Alkalihalobacillus algicola]MCA0986270.1 YslB family protein [Alkalihalobacillus algicola]